MTSDEARRADGQTAPMVSDLVECHICFSVIKQTSVPEHFRWHRIAGSPMGLGLYLLQFPEIEVTT